MGSQGLVAISSPGSTSATSGPTAAAPYVIVAKGKDDIEKLLPLAGALAPLLASNAGRAAIGAGARKLGTGTKNLSTAVTGAVDRNVTFPAKRAIRNLPQNMKQGASDLGVAVRDTFSPWDSKAALSADVQAGLEGIGRGVDRGIQGAKTAYSGPRGIRNLGNPRIGEMRQAALDAETKQSELARGKLLDTSAFEEASGGPIQPEPGTNPWADSAPDYGGASGTGGGGWPVGVRDSSVTGLGSRAHDSRERGPATRGEVQTMVNEGVKEVADKAQEDAQKIATQSTEQVQDAAKTGLGLWGLSTVMSQQQQNQQRNEQEQQRLQQIGEQARANAGTGGGQVAVS